MVAFIGAVAALFALQFDATARGPVGPGQVAVQARLGEPRTVLRLPPLGQISAPTHRSPLTLEAQVEEVDVDRLQALIAAGVPEEELRAQVTSDLEALLRSFLQRALIAAAIVGALAGALVPRRHWSHAVAGLLGGVVAMGLLVGGAWRGFDPEAFAEARFEGPIEQAPALLATVRRHVDDFDDVRRRVEVLGDQVAELYAVASTAGSVVDSRSEEEVRILHVSDIHSNPIGLEVTRQLAERFGIDAVLDTGDLTSFGLPLEARLGELIRDIPVPYLFVPGNHDSPGNRSALDEVDNVQLLDGNVVEVNGLRILGVADPTFTASNEINTAEARKIKRDRAPEVGAAVARETPDVLAVHDPVLGEGSFGQVPVIVAGHVHKRTAVRKEGTLVLTVGSTGATGLGSFLIRTDLSYEAQVLHFTDGELTSVDRVLLRGVDGAFRVERQLVTPSGAGAITARRAAGEIVDLP